MKGRWPLFGIFGAAFCAGSALADAPRFDLACQVEQALTSSSGVTTNRYSVEYRIDLALGVFCANACTRTARLADALPDRLVLVDSDGVADAVSGREKNRVEIDRASGAFSAASSADGLGVSSKSRGACVLTPFKPFPQTAF